MYHMHESGYTFILDVFYEAYLYLYVATHAECLQLRTFYFKHIAYFLECVCDTCCLFVQVCEMVF